MSEDIVISFLGDIAQPYLYLNYIFFVLFFLFLFCFVFFSSITIFLINLFITLSVISADNLNPAVCKMSSEGSRTGR